MRRPVLALAILAGVVLTIAGTGVAQAAPVLHLSGWKASAGKPETFTITRIGGNGPATVTFHTTNGTAVAPTDYATTTKTINWQNGQITATVQVPTFVNMAKAGTSVAFTATIAGSGLPSSATGLIVEPAAPPPPPPPPATSWITAPLQDGGFARVKADDSLWDITGPGAGRRLAAGEIVAVYFNGWGSESDGRIAFAIYAFADGSSGRAYAADLEGVAPIGTPPGLPADWWVPGLVTANKSCTDARSDHAGQPGVTQGGVYRAAMLIGTHHKLAPAETGWAGAMWEVFATGDQNAPDPKTALTVVSGDCLTGQ